MTLTSALLGLLLGATQASTCPDVVNVRGDDPDMVDQLSQGLLRSGIVATRLDRAPRCRALDVELTGIAPPYTLSLRGPGTAPRTWQVHLVDLAVAMVESELGTIRPPALPPQGNPTELMLSLRSDVSIDRGGFVFVGPGVQASLCGWLVCLDVLGHFGTAVVGVRDGGTRQDLAFAAGPSLRFGDRAWGVHVGTAAGGRWLDAVTPARAETAVFGLQDSFPFASLHEDELLFAWQFDVGAHAQVAEGWSLDGSVSLQLVPDGGAPLGTRGIMASSDVVVRFGVGVRWWVSG